MRFVRTLESYDPAKDLAERWPTWTVRFEPLVPGRGREQFRLDERIVIVDAEAARVDRELALAHVVAHLDLHTDCGLRVLTPAHEDQASFLAAVRLDRGQ